MSIFEAMERLAGAALLALAPAAGVTVPADHRSRGSGVVALLRGRGAGDLVDGYVGELTREIWVGAETRSLPQEALERHFADLAEIISGYDIDEACLEGALSASAGGDRGRRIAVDLFLKARTDGALDAHKLSDDVAMFVLERSFARLVRERQRIISLAPMLNEFVGARAASAPQPQPQPEAPRAPVEAPPQVAVASQPVAPRQVPPPLPPAAPMPTEMDERARIRAQYDVSEAAEARLMTLIEGQGASGASRIARLESIARWLQEARAQLMRPTNDDGDLRKLKMRAADALAAGDLALAMETLKQIRRALRDGRRRIEARLEDEVAALKAQMTEEARAAARLAELAFARRDYLAAADLFVEAADCLPKSAREEAWRYHLARADALLRKGEEEDDDTALGEALAGYGGVLKLLADGSNAPGAARANIGLGRALHRQAEPAAGVGRLADAIAAFRKALTLVSADDAVLWCEAQGALARSLMLSGQRARQMPPIREAVDAYRAALSAASDEVPMQSRLEINLGLGSALLELAEFDKSPDVIEGAAAAYRDALASLSRDEAPAAWAEASFNLGSALLARAEMRSEAGADPDRLAAAVAALTGAAEAMTPERDGDIWVNASLTLADALAALAETERPPTGRLRQAIAAYRRVLEVVDRAATPITWATASMNLGSALIRLGEQEDKRNNWLTAASAMVPALEVFEAQGATAHADLARRTLKRFHEEWVGLLAPQPTGPVAPPATPHLQQVG